MEKVIEQPWAKELKLKIGNHRMQPEWTSERWSWLDEKGKPIGPFAEPANSMLKDEVKQGCEQAPASDQAELKNMEDCEYEQTTTTTVSPWSLLKWSLTSTSKL